MMVDKFHHIDSSARGGEGTPETPVRRGGGTLNPLTTLKLRIPWGPPRTRNSPAEAFTNAWVRGR